MSIEEIQSDPKNYDDLFLMSAKLISEDSLPNLKHKITDLVRETFDDIGEDYLTNEFLIGLLECTVPGAKLPKAISLCELL